MSASSKPVFFSEILGSSLVYNNHQVYTDTLLGGKIVGLYFAASWCTPCDDFQELLVKFYQKTRSQIKDSNSRQLEIGMFKVEF